MVAGQALLAAGILAAPAAILGAVAIALGIAAVASHLAARPQRTETRDSDRSALTGTVDRHRLVGQIISGVAHDLNNMLATALGGLELMERRADDPERVLVLARRSMEAVEKAARLTGSLARFARREQIAPRPTDVNALIADLQPLIASALGRRIRLMIELESDLCHAHADAAGLEAALLGICLAARPAIAEGGQIALATRGEGAVPSVTVSGLSIIVSIESTRVQAAELDLSDVRRTAAAAGAALNVHWREGREREGSMAEISLILTRSR